MKNQMNFKQVLIFVLVSIMLPMVIAGVYDFGLKPYLSKKRDEKEK